MIPLVRYLGSWIFCTMSEKGYTTGHPLSSPRNVGWPGFQVAGALLCLHDTFWDPKLLLSYPERHPSVHCIHSFHDYIFRICFPCFNSSLWLVMTVSLKAPFWHQNLPETEKSGNEDEARRVHGCNFMGIFRIHVVIDYTFVKVPESVVVFPQAKFSGLQFCCEFGTFFKSS